MDPMVDPDPLSLCERGGRGVGPPERSYLKRVLLGISLTFDTVYPHLNPSIFHYLQREISNLYQHWNWSLYTSNSIDVYGKDLENLNHQPEYLSQQYNPG